MDGIRIVSKKKNKLRSGDKVVVIFETEVMDWDDDYDVDAAACICGLNGEKGNNKIDLGYLKGVVDHANGKVYRLKKS